MKGFASNRVIGALTVVLLGLCCAASAAANLDPSVEQQIRAATFEVVQLKPPDDTVSYERPLPLELIPYQQRVDKYRSVGTAFAIGPNRYVTAGHVLVVGAGSLYGPPALRDAAGKVYEIDKVLKYSDDQDFCEFSLKQDPSPETVLSTAAPPPLNDPVFAVGNALGEGVVIRDGVYTSQTPEEMSGRWQWLRFTAAASPGNSGGPLVDKNGKVIGIVLRKSEAENLNVAAPISLVAAASDSAGTIDSRGNFRLPIMEASEVMETHERVPLPATLADFYASMIKVMHSIVVRGDTQLQDHNKDRLFPNSASSATLLSQVCRSPLPRVIYEQQDRNWGLLASPQVQETQLDHNGFVRSSASLYRLRAPDNVKLADLYGDSKVYMDLLLRSGLALNRTVGTATDKVTSLGKAQQEFTNTDAYGRTWQVKIWAVPFDDNYLVTMNLPTPEGYVALIMRAGGSVKDVMLEEQKLLVNFMYVTFEATLPRWHEYLSLRSYQPKVFSSFNLVVDNASQQVSFASKRMELHVTPAVLSLSATTVLAVDFSYFKDGGAVVWDVGGIVVGESVEKNEYIDVRRASEPDPSLPQSTQSNWKKLLAGEYPYNGVAADDKGGLRAFVLADPPVATGTDPAKVRYVLGVRVEGAPTQDAMQTQLQTLAKAFKDLEH
jgi:serine protease Do